MATTKIRWRIERAYEELNEMDKNEVAQHLRALPQTAGGLPIAVTGYGQQDDRKVIHAAGVDHHLVKPVDLKKLDCIPAEVASFR